MQCPKVSDEALAAEAWRRVQNREKSKESFVAKPKDWPKQLNRVLDKHLDYPSPSVPGQCQSMLAWQWLLLKNAGQHYEAATAWWSRLVPHHSVVLGALPSPAVCLFTGRWGCIVEELTERTDGAWAWRLVRGSIHLMHLCSPWQVFVVSVEGAALQDATDLHKS